MKKREQRLWRERVIVSLATLLIGVAGCQGLKSLTLPTPPATLEHIKSEKGATLLPKSDSTPEQRTVLGIRMSCLADKKFTLRYKGNVENYKCELKQ